MAEWVFVVPQNWPPPPAGWTPPTGWQPDPSWGPAPDGWEFWRWQVEPLQADAPLHSPTEFSRPGPVVAGLVERSGSGREDTPGFFAVRRQHREDRAAAQRGFEAIAMAAATGDPESLQLFPEAVSAARRHYRDREWDKKRFDVIKQAVRHVVTDDLLTSAEEANVSKVLDAFGVTTNDLLRHDPALYEELIVARINDGRPPVLSNPAALLKKGETAHGQYPASLMKEVVRRQYRGGSSGVSIPIGFGVRYRVGRYRGKSVVVGTDLVPSDSGHLVVTSSRAVFVGTKKTLEFRFDRLVGLQQFRDGLRLNVSNRQAASLFKIPPTAMPAIAAALISWGASRN